MIFPSGTPITRIITKEEWGNEGKKKGVRNQTRIHEPEGSAITARGPTLGHESRGGGRQGLIMFDQSKSIGAQKLGGWVGARKVQGKLRPGKICGEA